MRRLFMLLTFAATTLLAAPPADLPAPEKELADTVDHWGLPFSDQLRRFNAGAAALKQELGDAAPKSYLVGIQHAVEKVPANKYWFKGEYTATVELSAARNETESFQVAVLPMMGKELEKVALTAGPLAQVGGEAAIPPENVTLYRVGYVETARAGYAVLWTGLWPDPLWPNAPISIKGTDLGLFWVDVKVPKDAPAGDYAGRFIVTADGEETPVTVRLHVYDFALPDRVPYPLGVWTRSRTPDNKPMTRDETRAMWAEFLRHGVDPLAAGAEEVDLKSATPDFSAVESNLEFCFERGLQIFDLPRSNINQIERLRPYVEFLRGKGWLDKALLYSCADEPEPAVFREKNIPFAQKVHALLPGLRVYLATQWHPGIDLGCDVWLTDLSTGFGMKFNRAERGNAALWVYYCHLPIHVDLVRPLTQSLNMEIDSEAVEHRLIHWYAWKNDIKGGFIWAGNNEWRKDLAGVALGGDTRWKLSADRSKFPFGGIHNGNGYLLYPGPAPSIRLKVLRDGSEDYGYFLELKRRLDAHRDRSWFGASKAAKSARPLLDVPAEVLMDAHYFNRDPRAILAARDALARAIERLGD